MKGEFRRILGVGIVSVLGLTSAPGAGPQYEVLHVFNGGDVNDGAAPQDASVVLDAAGNIYGTTFVGGTGWGTVWTIPSDGSGFRLIHRFAPSEGALPDATLLLDKGTLYGTTWSYGQFGSGSVFKVKTDGSGFLTLHHFAGGVNGAQPLGSLVLDASGNLYGTTNTGGSSNLGTIFTLTTSGANFQVLHSFTGVGANGGANPWSGLVLQGNDLYGTTTAGGAADLGSIFTLTTSGTGYTVLHSFDGDGGQGGYPIGGLAQDSGGFLYGTTGGGGSHSLGTVFRIGPSGADYIVLYEFGTSPSDGSPRGPLALAGSSLFGATMSGGVFGTVFTIQTDGSDYSIVHSFPVAADGTHPRSSVVVDTAGALYGTTQTGGSNNSDGVVFKLTGIVVDTTKPEVICTSPATTGWFGANVIVNCTASDSGSGLANPGDGNFMLSTNVLPDVEERNANTDSRSICDAAGNCRQAGPFGPYMIDLKAPTISITAPVDNDDLLVGQAVAAHYNCNDGGSGLAACTAPVADGSNIDTASAGLKTFTVNASDQAGNTNSQTINYTVTAVRTATTISLSSSRNPSLVGDLVTITATVTGSAPTRSVAFTVDTNAPVNGTITGSSPTTLTATIQVNLPVGVHPITATYSGDANNAGSTTTVALDQNVLVADTSGTAVRGIVTGFVRLSRTTEASITPRDRIVGGFATDSALDPTQMNVTNVGGSFARAWLPMAPVAPLVRGPYVSARSSSDTFAKGASGARGIAYVTVVNPSTQAVRAVASAFLGGSFGGSAVSHASGAVYVFDRDAFLNAIRTSQKTPEQFFLSGTTQATLTAWAAGDEASLGLVPVIGISPLEDPDFQVVSGSSGPAAANLNTTFDVNPGEAVVVVFDLTVYSPAGGIADFSATLKPAPNFLTDPDGNPTPLTVVGLWSPPPPTAANLALVPAATTSPLTTPVTVTASATTQSGVPVPNTQVFLEITSGPNAQPIGPAVTDANGQVSFTYSGGSSTGTDEIRASIGTLQSNVTHVTWTSGPLDHVAISPASATIAAGQSQAYTAQALDAFDNSLGDVTAATTFSISPDGSCTGSSCTASVGGPHTVTAVHSGKTATAALEVTSPPSGFTFHGFFDPIQMSTPALVVWNTIKAGQGVPVKWLLTSNGSPVSDPTSFAGLSSYPVACSSGGGSIEDAIDQTATGGSGLQYNGGGNWQFNWDTLKSYRNSCRGVVVRFSDGTTSPAAMFKFK